MKDNTYDAPGIKFGIFISKELPNIDDKIFQEETIKQQRILLDNIYKSKDSYIIDFNKIDGLTIGEILDFNDIQMKNTIVIVAYAKIDYDDRYGHKYKYNHILYNIIVNKNEFNKNTPIEKEVEKIIMHHYNSDDKIDERNERCIKCFLERYRYGSKEKTDEKLKEYTK